MANSAGEFFTIALFSVAACYGGFAATASPITADYFGLKNLRVNFGFVFPAFGFAGVLGPQIGARLSEKTGSFDQAFLVVAGLCAVGIVITAFCFYNYKRGADG
jgi:OFA family oxalate/formate antiporter-like MFS transporter